MCQFINTQPFLYFRDAEGGRIKVLNRAGDYLATLVPPGLLSDEAGLLFRNNAEDEFRGSWGFLAMILSAYQQSGGDFNEVYEVEESYYSLFRE
jgi:hypothetical protein